MPVWHYSVKVKKEDEERVAKAMVWDAPVSLKETYEIFKIIRGMKLKEAKKLLEDIIALKSPIPYVRYKLQVAHKRGLPQRYPRWKTPIGRYPVKAAKAVLKLLKNAENNAEQKQLDIDRLVIIHAAVHKGRYLKRWVPRAFGRATPKVGTMVNMEVIVKEV